MSSIPEFDKLIKLVENHVETSIPKLRLLGIITRAKKNEERLRASEGLIEKLTYVRTIEVILDTPTVKIYKDFSRSKFSSDEDPYRCIYFKDGKWHSSPELASTFNGAFLSYLKMKYLSLNNDFVYLVSSMLKGNDDPEAIFRDEEQDPTQEW